jgi:amidase
MVNRAQRGDGAEETALEAADGRRRDRARGGRGFHGVPFTVKVNVDVAGSATTAGMPVFIDALPAGDAPVVARLRTAGAIPIARTNMPDGGMRWHTASSLHGVTLNPWNPALTPGGSSGGEGPRSPRDADAAGVGNDIGGSVRGRPVLRRRPCARRSAASRIIPPRSTSSFPSPTRCSCRASWRGGRAICASPSGDGRERCTGIPGRSRRC